MTICKIKTIKNNNRMSTQELLQTIYKKIEEGHTEFEIEACGQHDIGGAVWSRGECKEVNGDSSSGAGINRDEDGQLYFHITNPGQRVGAMAMDGVKIVVEGSAPADIGWLNSGAEIVIKGDGGDTAAHCAAGGKIYVGGRVGTRSGALMKHDPRFEPPQFWVLKNTGSFSFEFMGGGIAVICGYDCDNLSSVLGNRSCVGMVGGVVYVRGKVEGLAECVEQVSLDKLDKDFLKSGMPEFLKEIERPELEEELLDFSGWTKILPLPKELKEKKQPVKEFIKNEWFKDGLFGDLVEDNGEVFGLAETGNARLRKPEWDKDLCVSCDLCLKNCPQNAIKKDFTKYVSESEKCIGCGICAAVCPRNAWKMY